MGRIATRASPSATTSLAADAAREIDEALAASGVIETDDNLHSIAKELGYSAREAELAIIAGLRLGLFSVEE